jgi:hypothetical protein
MTIIISVTVKMAVIILIMLIIDIISFVFSILFTIFGIYEHIMGPAGAEKLLKIIHIPLSFDQVIIIGFVFIALMFVSRILRAKFSGRL